MNNNEVLLSSSEQEKETSVAAKILGCLVIWITLPLIILLRSFVLTQLWFWFIVPFGLPAISQPHAYGISILILIFTPGAAGYVKDEEESSTTRFLLIGFAVPLLALGGGWICHNWM